ncbi:MAG: PAS domain-containing protein [Betaproteobacteria bacterium]|nr:PAS domain-containing protein [Betaproteobacteria bacterium]
MDSLESQIKTLKAQIADGNNRERQLGILLESANYGVWDWYVQTGKITVSERCANIIGYTLEEISREWINLWEESVHPDDRKESDRLLEEHWAGKSDYYFFEARLKHKNGLWV